MKIGDLRVFNADVGWYYNNRMFVITHIDDTGLCRTDKNKYDRHRLQSGVVGSNKHFFTTVNPCRTKNVLDKIDTTQ